MRPTKQITTEAVGLLREAVAVHGAPRVADYMLKLAHREQLRWPGSHKAARELIHRILDRGQHQAFPQVADALEMALSEIYIPSRDGWEHIEVATPDSAAFEHYDKPENREPGPGPARDKTGRPVTVRPALVAPPPELPEVVQPNQDYERLRQQYEDKREENLRLDREVRGLQNTVKGLRQEVERQAGKTKPEPADPRLLRAVKAIVFGREVTDTDRLELARWLILNDTETSQ